MTETADVAPVSEDQRPAHEPSSLVAPGHSTTVLKRSEPDLELLPLEPVSATSSAVDTVVQLEPLPPASELVRPGPRLVPDELVRLEPGGSTADELNVPYRISRITDLLRGRWLDYGCADGGYDQAMLEAGVSWLDGIDVEEERVRAARSRNLPNATYQLATDCSLPFEDAIFDGVWMNEVLEHVVDEQASLREVHRVLKPGGFLVLVSPNRWFPFEGHGMRWRGFTVEQPVPLLPWLPLSLSRHLTRARNYWPHEMRAEVERAGLRVTDVSFIWPVFAAYPWMPKRVLAWYQQRLPSMHEVPVIRRFGVSTLVVAVRTV